MKKTTVVLCVLTLLGVAYWAQARMMAITKSGGTVAAGGPSGQNFSDLFTRGDSDSLGGNWTEQVGDADIVSNAMSFQTAGWDKIVAIYSGTATDTANQYIKVNLAYSAPYPAIILRYTNSSSPYYVIQASTVSSCEFIWAYYPDATTGSGTDIGASADAGTCSDPTSTIGVTITGTGDNTVVRIWNNPTANTPVSASEWDSGDSTPDITWTDNPGVNAVNTGGYVGVQGIQESAGNIVFYDFYAGDAP